MIEDIDKISFAYDIMSRAMSPFAKLFCPLLMFVTERSLHFNCEDNKKAVLPQGNRAMPQVFFSVEVRQQHSLQV